MTMRTNWRPLAVALSISFLALPASAQEPPAASSPKAAVKRKPAATPGTSGSSSTKKAAKPAPEERKENPLYAKGIGFSVRPLTASERKKLGRTHGLYVDHIVKGTPADEGGLKKGDVIMSIEGKTASSAKETIDLVNSSEEGVTLTFVIVRGGKDSKVQIRLPGKSPEERAEEERKEREEREARERKEREEREEREKKEREAREKREAAEKAEAEGEGAEVEADDDDGFSMCNFCLCSAVCPPLMPVWAAMAVFAENDALPEEPPESPIHDDSRVITVAY